MPHQPALGDQGEGRKDYENALHRRAHQAPTATGEVLIRALEGGACPDP